MSDDPVTTINIFAVTPARQAELIALLVAATESVRHADGFLSARLHQSLDGTQVAMYAQWRSSEAYEAMRTDATSLMYFQQALAFATFAPGIYRVAQSFAAAR